MIRYVQIRLFIHVLLFLFILLIFPFIDVILMHFQTHSFVFSRFFVYLHYFAVFSRCVIFRHYFLIINIYFTLNQCFVCLHCFPFIHYLSCKPLVHVQNYSFLLLFHLIIFQVYYFHLYRAASSVQESTGLHGRFLQESHTFLQKQPYFPHIHNPKYNVHVLRRYLHFLSSSHIKDHKKQHYLPLPFLILLK